MSVIGGGGRKKRGGRVPISILKNSSKHTSPEKKQGAFFIHIQRGKGGKQKRKRSTALPRHGGTREKRASPARPKGKKKKKKGHRARAVQGKKKKKKMAAVSKSDRHSSRRHNPRARLAAGGKEGEEEHPIPKSFYPAKKKKGKKRGRKAGKKK